MMTPIPDEENVMTNVSLVEVPEANKGASFDDEVPAFVLEQIRNPCGLSDYEKRLAEFGYNEVKVKEKPVWMQIASRFLGIVPLFITTTAILSAAIKSNCDE